MKITLRIQQQRHGHIYFIVCTLLVVMRSQLLRLNTTDRLLQNDNKTQ